MEDVKYAHNLYSLHVRSKLYSPTPCMYGYKMTSIFEVLSNKARLAEDDHSNARDEKDQSAIQTKKEDELTSEKYFMICKTCFWCASYIDIMDTNSLPYKVC